MASRVKTAAQSESVPSRLSHVVPLLIAGYLLAAPRVPISLLDERFVPLAIWPAALGAALMFAGVVFSVWARFVLAANWSSLVQLKQDHELIVEGPYRWVRHPIYTGVLLMFAGNGLGGRRVAGPACRGDRGGRILAEAAARGDCDARAVRGRLRALRRARSGAHSAPALKTRMGAGSRDGASSSSRNHAALLGLNCARTMQLPLRSDSPVGKFSGAVSDRQEEAGRRAGGPAPSRVSVCALRLTGAGRSSAR